MTAQFPLVPTDHPTPPQTREEILADPGFGRHFTDHMATACGRRTPVGTTSGWAARAVHACDPGAAVLHYAQEIFEGLKAFRHADGSVWLFRPELNAAPVRRSARRLALPELAEETSSRAWPRWSAPTRPGCRRTAASRASTCGRSCSPPRRSSGCGRRSEVTYCVHRLARPASYFPGGVSR